MEVGGGGSRENKKGGESNAVGDGSSTGGSNTHHSFPGSIRLVPEHRWCLRCRKGSTREKNCSRKGTQDSIVQAGRSQLKSLAESKQKGGIEMEWQVILALVLVIPIVLIPVVFVWYLNIGGVYAAIKEARARRVTQEKGIRAVVEHK